MADEVRVGPVSELKPPKLVGADGWAVGSANDEYFAVGRRCRHLYADLAGGVVARDGCLVCPWHGSRYNVKTGRMVSGPRGIYGKVPGLGTFYKTLTRILPLARGTVVERKGDLFVR